LLIRCQAHEFHPVMEAASATHNTTHLHYFRVVRKLEPHGQNRVPVQLASQDQAQPSGAEIGSLAAEIDVALAFENSDLNGNGYTVPLRSPLRLSFLFFQRFA